MQDTHATPLHSGMDGWQRDLMIRMTRKSEKPSQPRSFIFTSKRGALPFPITSPPPFRHLIFFDWVWLLWTEHLFCRLFVRRWRSSVPNSSCLNRERRAKYLTPFVLRSFVGFRSWANRMFCHVSQSQDILQRNGSINASLARLRNLQFLPAPGRWPTTKRVMNDPKKVVSNVRVSPGFSTKTGEAKGPTTSSRRYPVIVRNSSDTAIRGQSSRRGSAIETWDAVGAEQPVATNSVKESSFGTKTSAKCGLIYSNVYIYMYTYIVCTYYQI